MKDQIIANMNNPQQLERLYRGNKALFRRDFNEIYPELEGNALTRFWYERLNFDSEGINWGTGKEILLVLAGALIAGFLAKIPHIFGINEEFFYPRNIGFIFLPMLTAYFAWRNKLGTKKVLSIFGIILGSLLYINLFPTSATESDTFILACIHLPLLLWVLLGSAFVGRDLSDQEKRLQFLSYNGELIVMTGLILIAGGAMTGITIGLFSVIGIDIEEFYFRNIVIFGLPAAPILGTYLTQANPNLVGKVSPVIARIFSPLVLVMLVIYLGAMVFSAGDPYNDREFLLVFNVLLVGVMAIIFFSVAETSRGSNTSAAKWVLLLLSAVTIIVNGIALSAILFRISEWGITPNRAAVMGGNILILLNLLAVTVQLFKVVFQKKEIRGVGRAISRFLPIYFAWTLIVVFLFPLIFGFD